MSRKECAQSWIKGGRILSVKTNYERKIVAVDMLGCPDMKGGIRFGQFVMPEVTEIQFFWEGKPDTLYFKKGGGEWAARDLRRLSNDAG
jgi:hypothetical protein